MHWGDTRKMAGDLSPIWINYEFTIAYKNTIWWNILIYSYVNLDTICSLKHMIVHKHISVNIRAGKQEI